MSASEPILVADIGGTNARFAIAYNDDPIRLENILVLATHDYASLQDAVETYLDKWAQDRPSKACLAVAGPVVEDEVHMTNCPWLFYQSKLANELKMDQVIVLNDFEAIACALPYLPDNQLRKIGGGAPKDNGNYVVVGPGTGIGVAGLTQVDNGWKVLGSEAGHIGFAPGDDFEQEILKVISRDYPRVSVERLLSGNGFCRIYNALGHVKDISLQPLTPAEITKAAFEETSDICKQTVHIFCSMLGSFAGDMAITFNATSGVYLAGGIIPKIQPIFEKSFFRQKFENKGRLDYIQDIPTYQITEEHPALIGAAAKLQGKLF